MSHRPRSLVLAAHGSLASENANQPLHELAVTVQTALQSPQYSDLHSAFDYVTPAFLCGHPEISNVLETLPPGEIVVIPVMTSDGYYLQKIRGKLEENDGLGRGRVVVTSVLGMHASIPRRIGKRISGWLAENQLQPESSTVVVVGHGTRRNTTSGQATLELTRTLSRQFPSLRVEVAFLDQDPAIESVATKIETENTLVIPFLISRGPHTTEDVPRAFGLPTGPEIEFPQLKQTDAGICTCDLPVGMYPGIAEVCLDLARSAIGRDAWNSPCTMEGANQ